MISLPANQPQRRQRHADRFPLGSQITFHILSGDCIVSSFVSGSLHIADGLVLPATWEQTRRGLRPLSGSSASRNVTEITNSEICSRIALLHNNATVQPIEVPAVLPVGVERRQIANLRSPPRLFGIVSDRQGSSADIPGGKTDWRSYTSTASSTAPPPMSSRTESAPRYRPSSRSKSLDPQPSACGGSLLQNGVRRQGVWIAINFSGVN
jgi:hypothetical protein